MKNIRVGYVLVLGLLAFLISSLMVSFVSNVWLTSYVVPNLKYTPVYTNIGAPLPFYRVLDKQNCILFFPGACIVYRKDLLSLIFDIVFWMVVVYGLGWLIDKKENANNTDGIRKRI